MNRIWKIAILVLNRERILGSGHTLLPNISGSIPRVVATSMDSFPSAEGAGYLLGNLGIAHVSNTAGAWYFISALLFSQISPISPQKRCVDINFKISNYNFFIGCNKKWDVNIVTKLSTFILLAIKNNLYILNMSKYMAVLAHFVI